MYSNSDLLESDYKDLIFGFLGRDDYEIRAQVGPLHRIYVDEFQDLSEKLLSVVRRLCEIYEIEILYIAGDRLQNKYGKSIGNSGEDYFGALSTFFGKDIDKVIHLKRNYRVKTPRLLHALNTFLSGMGLGDEDFYDEVGDGVPVRPQFRLCNRRQDERVWVEKMINPLLFRDK